MSGVCLAVGRSKGMTVHARSSMLFPLKGRQEFGLFTWCASVEGRCSDIAAPTWTESTWEQLVWYCWRLVFNPVGRAIHHSLGWEKLTVLVSKICQYYFFSLGHSVYQIQLFVTLMPTRFIYSRNNILTNSYMKSQEWFWKYFVFGSNLYLILWFFSDFGPFRLGVCHVFWLPRTCLWTKALFYMKDCLL